MGRSSFARGLFHAPPTPRLRTVRPTQLEQNTAANSTLHGPQGLEAKATKRQKETRHFFTSLPATAPRRASPEWLGKRAAPPDARAQAQVTPGICT